MAGTFSNIIDEILGGLYLNLPLDVGSLKASIF
jgi:hypothetical protein